MPLSPSVLLPECFVVAESRDEVVAVLVVLLARVVDGLALSEPSAEADAR